jgi:N-acetyl-1-D-myo-inositol-2-amino-2-deoxy-alpha-D-glucopyranoside deacetylase
VLPTSARSRTDEVPPSLGVRIAGVLSSLVLGVGTGTIGTFAHQATWSTGAAVLPVGLIAAVLAVACLVAGLRIALDSRLHAALAALGAVVAVAVLALPGPSGSALLPANPTGFAWTIVPTLVCAVILAWPRTLRLRGSGARNR